MATDNAFTKYVNRTARQFLQTVVMVDDEAFRAEPPDGERLEESSTDTGGRRLLRHPGADLPDELDPKRTTNAFASRGLACAVLSPQSREENEEVLVPLVATARRADLVVVDWNLNGDIGGAALKIVRAVLKDDDGDERRLRVLAIYPGEATLRAIEKELSLVVEELMPDTELRPDEDSMPGFTSGPVRVVVLAKEHVELPGDLQAQRVSVEGLPERLTEEFAAHCRGLLASAALTALTGVRNEAHRLLTALGEHVDPALLGQRVALNHPSDIERQVEALLAAEMASVIADQEVGKSVNLTRSKQWVGAREGLAAGGTISEPQVTKAHREGFLRIGLGDDRIPEQNELTKISKRKLQDVHGRATELFSLSEDEATHAGRLFSELMVVRTRYRKPIPELRLGAIVANRDTYLLCIQPVCDSLRLKKPTTFPFLELELKEPEDVAATIMLRDDTRQGWIGLGIDSRPARIVTHRFSPTAGERVGAPVRNGSPRFRAAGKGAKNWRWVADLKTEYAQRVVEQLGRQVSRIGLDEPELLRGRV